LEKLEGEARKIQEEKLKNSEEAHCALDDVMYLAQKFQM
jgi:hypothetical protein